MENIKYMIFQKFLLVLLTVLEPLLSFIKFASD